MIPVALSISGFLSYKTQVELDFTSFDLACISGANGAGKSSLLDAITWALFGQARRRDDAIINSHASAAEVRLDFLYEGLLYRIQRTKPRDKTTLLEFMVKEEGGVWRPLTEHSVRDTEMRIQSILRLDYETFTNASFFLQGKADQFAQQRPGDRKRILSSILGLDAWENYRQTAADRRRGVENETNIYTNQLNEIEEELKQEPDRRARLAQLQSGLEEATRQKKGQEKNLENARRISAALEEQRRLLELLQTSCTAAEQRAQATLARLNQRRAEQAESSQQIALAVQVENDYQAWQRARQNLQHWEEIAANFRQHESERAAPLMKIESERSRLDQEMTTLQSQAKTVADLETQLPLMQKRLAESEAEVTALTRQLAEREMLENQLSELQEQRAARSAENDRLRLEMNQVKERILRLAAAESREEEASAQVCPLCGQPLSAVERARLVTELETQGKEMGDRYRTNFTWLAQVDGQRTQIQKLLNDLKEAETSMRQHQRQADAMQDRLDQMHQALDEWQRSGALRLRELERMLNEGRYALKARAELAKVDAQLKNLGYDAAQHDAVRTAEQAGRSSEEALRRLEAARASLAPLQREIQELETHLAAEQEDLSRQQAASQQAAAQFAAASSGLPEIKQVENDLFLLQEQENRLRMQVGGALQAVEVYKTLRIRLASLQEERKILTLQIGRLKTLEQAFGKDGVPALLIEQALPEIEAQANEILDRLTSGNMSVRFATQKDYKDKNREDKKETLDILISDAAGTREYELFSGGEAFRVNFAIRLALSRVLAQRAGARLQTLVIDEGFGSQDNEGRQRLVEAINLVRADFAKVLVITHLEELKEAFPSRIEVEKWPEGSRVKVIQ